MAEGRGGTESGKRNLELFIFSHVRNFHSIHFHQTKNSISCTNSFPSGVHMDKRKITAKEILKDIKAGASDSDLMEKYTLSAQGLQSVFNKLVNSKMVTQAELDDRVPLTERTVDLGLFICPACGNIQGKEFVTCPRCNFTAPHRSRQSAAATPEVHTRRPATKIVERSPKIDLTPPRVERETVCITKGLAEQSIDELSKTAAYCRTLGIAALAVYFLIVVGMFVVMMVSDGTNPASAGFLATALMGIPAVMIGFILFVVLKALAESVTVFVDVTNSLSKN
jgi:hypothetical protein